MKRQNFRLSRWSKYFPRNGITAFFHSILLNVIFVPTETAEKILNFFSSPKDVHEIINKIGRETMELLQNQGFIISDGNNDYDILHKIRDELKSNITLESMYLLLTDGCNLRCKYCFEDTPFKKKIFHPVMMDKDVAKKSVDLFAFLTQEYGNTEKKKVIHLYGGEPLLNMEVVKFVIPYINELKKSGNLQKDCNIVVVTNGTQITNDTAKLFHENSVTVGISLDGPEHLNNMYRVSPSISDVYSAAVAAYNILKKNGVIVGLSTTLTPEVVNNFDSVLNFFIDELGIQDGISFNILHYNPAVSVDVDYFEKAAKCIIQAFERFRVLGVYEERMMRKAKAFIAKKPIFADCSVVGSQMVIAPDGKIGVCQDFVKPRTYFKGSVFEKNYDPFKSGLFMEWQNRSPFYMEQCFDCEALGLCGGGCPASVELKTGSRWNIDKRICFHSKLTLEWLIWETFAKL